MYPEQDAYDCDMESITFACPGVMKQVLRKRDRSKSSSGYYLLSLEKCFALFFSQKSSSNSHGLVSVTDHPITHKFQDWGRFGLGGMRVKKILLILSSLQINQLC